MCWKGLWPILLFSFQNILVHNWTQDVVLRWLREFVELPQYEKNFKEFKVNGNTLPRWGCDWHHYYASKGNKSYYHSELVLTSVCRIAANEPSFLSFHLRIQDQRDKQKLNIKALDAVLFGPPTRKDQFLPLSCVSFSFFLLDTWERKKIF